MKNLLIILLVFAALGCQRTIKPHTPADPYGNYKIEYYIVDGDTVFSKSGINKYSMQDSYYWVDSRSADSVSVAERLQIKDGINNVSTVRIVSIQKTDDAFKLTDTTATANNKITKYYESTIKNGVFREHIIGFNFYSLIERRRYDSLGTSYTPIMHEIIVQARK